MDYETDVTVREERGLLEPTATPPRTPARAVDDGRWTTGSSITVEHLRWRRISWRAILGGAAVALALQTPLILLGLGIGMINAEAISSAADIALVTWIWWMAAGIVALFFGAWVAGHLVAPATPLDGAMNGFVTWAVLTLVMLWLATTAATSVVGGAWSVVTGASEALVEGGSRADEVMIRTQSGRRQQAGAASAQPSGDGGAARVQVDWSAVDPEVDEFLGQQGIDTQGLSLEDEFKDSGDQPVRTTEELYASMKSWLSGSPEARQRVETYLTDNTDMTQQEVDQRLDQWERQARATAGEAGEAVEEGTEAIGKAALWSAAASLVGLLAAGAGGAVGAASASPGRRRRA